MYIAGFSLHRGGRAGGRQHGGADGGLLVEERPEPLDDGGGPDALPRRGRGDKPPALPLPH